jgi:hypothetical protein
MVGASVLSGGSGAGRRAGARAGVRGGVRVWGVGWVPVLGVDPVWAPSGTHTATSATPNAP